MKSILPFFITFTLYICFFPNIKAQDNFTNGITFIENLIEKIARDSEEDYDYTTLFNDLSYFFENPLNLNTAGREELEQLHLLTDFQISSLLDYINNNGNLLSMQELMLVYGFTEETTRQMESFTTVVPTLESTRDLPVDGFWKKSENQFFVRASAVLQKQHGYTAVADSILEDNPNARYMGSPVKLYTRYIFEYNNKLRVGYTGEKDAGEEFFRGSNKPGFDFNSAHVQISNTWKIKDFIFGDYQVKFGQGVNFWSGLGFGKSPDVINTRKKSADLSRYSSTDENGFLRGAGLTLTFNRLDVTGFVSGKNIDANITERDSTDDEPLSFSSLQTSGLHALPRQVEDEDAIHETIAGGHVTYHFDLALIGLSLVHYRFNAHLEREPEPYNTFSFSGTKNTNYGIDYAIRLNRISLYGEGGISSNAGFAMLNGMVADISPFLKLSILQRFYQKEFQALYGNAFSESSGTSNENGLYLGMVTNPLKSWTFSAYLDAFSFPWLRYNTDSPAVGFDYFLQADYQAVSKLNAYIRYSNLVKPENISDDVPGIDDVIRKYLSRLRIHISYPVSAVLTFQDRLELSYYRKGENGLKKGYLIYHDVIYKPSGIPLSFTLRYAMFDTDGWDPRIYTYEHDVLYAYAIPSFYDKGIRTYLNTRINIDKHVDLWLKISNTFYANRESIATGLDEIGGKNKTDVRIQVRVRF